jgi:hypothetical protein
MIRDALTANDLLESGGVSSPVSERSYSAIQLHISRLVTFAEAVKAGFP